MSELCCKFQVPVLDTVGAVAETRTVLQNVTDGWTYVHTDNGKTIYSSSFHVWRIKMWP